MDETTRAANTTPAGDLGGDWFDPLEEAVRGQVRGFIERLTGDGLWSKLGLSIWRSRSINWLSRSMRKALLRSMRTNALESCSGES
jgi:hypothetical protein